MDGNLIFYNSRDKYFKNPFGAVSCNEKVNLRLKVNKNIVPEKVFLRLWNDNGKEDKIQMKAMEEEGKDRIYETEIQTPDIPGLIWYYFILCLHNGNLYYGNNIKRSGGIGSVYRNPPDSYQLTVYKSEAKTPVWFIESIMYQIFVDRFYNGCENGQVLNQRKGILLRNDWEDCPEYIRDSTGSVIQYDFFGGNLMGIIKKLGYLKSLNVGVIYLNPIFESPSNHKYDTADYKNIDRMFGNNETFRVLCNEANSLGIKIILDGVFSHTGSDSIYFNKNNSYSSIGAYQSISSPYYSWYRFINHPKEYDSWWGIDTLPNVNELDNSYENFIIFDKDSVIKHWMKLGAKGWRLDVADELPDEFIKSLREEIKNVDSESILIGEVWEDASNKSSYEKRREYLLGEEFDSVMNYPFRNIMLDFVLGRQSSFDTAERLMQLYENYPVNNFYSSMNLIGSHDVPRILTILEEDASNNYIINSKTETFSPKENKKLTGIKRLKILSLMQMTFPGVPCIYYGDEAGVEGGDDPLNRGTYPWGKENKELLHWYTIITALRNKYDVLKTGDWHPITPNEDIFGYARNISCKDIFDRERKSNSAVLLVNKNLNSLSEVNLYIGRNESFRMYNVLDKNKEYEIIDGRLEVKIPPLGYLLLLLNP